MLRQCLVILSAVAATTTAQTACQDEASCQAAAALLPGEPFFRVLTTQTKGCFEKGGTVYWSAGGTEEENAKPAPGQQSRVYCDAIVEEDGADAAATTTTAAPATEGPAVSIELDDVSEETTASSTVAATTEAAATTEWVEADGDAENTPFELADGVEVEEVVVVVGDEPEVESVAPPAEKPAPSPPSAADDRTNRFSAKCFVIGSLWLSLVVLSC